jgi:hypothetical protein
LTAVVILHCPSSHSNNTDKECNTISHHAVSLPIYNTPPKKSNIAAIGGTVRKVIDRKTKNKLSIENQFLKILKKKTFDTSLVIGS